MFIDSTEVNVRAGRGGDGCVSFRREKHITRGGPNGGDGGHGGSIVLKVDPNFNTLLHLHHRRHIKAKPGAKGGSSNKTGASAANMTLLVPPGTIVRDSATSELLGDMVEPGSELVVAVGGRGGRGNTRFASSTNRAPRRADSGKDGEERLIQLELKLLADLGLVGLPNAGKSTLLSRLSAARPKVADYPFTTLEPYLGVVSHPSDDYKTLVMADIPGLIEGAHEGAGLGIQFLRHIERCTALAHLVDLSVEQSIAERVEAIRHELEAFSDKFKHRPWILVGTKIDAVADREQAIADLEAVAADFGVPHDVMSAVTGDGLKRVTTLFFNLTRNPEETL